MFPKRMLVKLLHDLWRMKYRTIVIIATIATSVSIYTGTYTALRSIEGTCQKLYRELRLSDLQFNFIPTTEDELPEEEQYPKGIHHLEKRLILPGRVESRGDKSAAMLLIFLNEEKRPEVNRLKIMKGSYFTRGMSDSVLLDYSFARHYGYEVGDEITLGLQGFFSVFKIAGLVVNAEFLVTSANPDYCLPVKGSLGIAYLPLRTIEELFGYRIYNNLSLTLARGFKPNAMVRSLDGLLREHKIEPDNVLFQDDIFSIKIIRRDMKSLFLALPAIVSVFILISFLILFCSMSRMVQQDMTQLGTLMAMGYSHFQLLGAYLTAGALLGFTGFLMGWAGSNILADLVVKSYMAGTGLPLIFRFYSFRSFLLSFLFSLGLTMAASGIPLRPISRLNIAEILGRTQPREMDRSFGKSALTQDKSLRPLRPSAGGLKVLAERGVLLKIGMRNMQRRKIFFLLSTLGITFGIAVTGALLMTDASIHRTIDDFFALEQWDLFVPFSGPVEKGKAESLKEIGGISRFSLYRKGLVTLSFKDKMKYSGRQVSPKDYKNDIRQVPDHLQMKPYQLAGIPPGDSLIKPDIVEGSFFSSDRAKEIILNVEMKNQYHLEIGDLIPVVIGGVERARLKLVGVMNNFMTGQGFIPLGIAAEVMGERQRYTGAFLTLARPFEEVKDRLHQLDFLGYIVRKDEVRNTFKASLSKFSTFINTYSLMSIFLSIGIIFVNLFLNITAREGEYAVLLAHGFGKKEIGLIIVYEILFILMVAVVATIPLTILISKFFCYKIAQAAIIVNLRIRIVDYLKVFIPTMLCMAGAASYCITYASSIDIAGTVRNRISN